MQYWSFCDLWRWFALVEKTTFSSTEWFQTQSQNFQTPSDRGYFFYFFSKSYIFFIFLPRTAYILIDPPKWVSWKIWTIIWWCSTTLSEIENYNSWHCIDMIQNIAFPIGEIFFCIGARPLQIQSRHYPPNSSEEGEWINWDVWQVVFF